MIAAVPAAGVLTPAGVAAGVQAGPACLPVAAWPGRSCPLGPGRAGAGLMPAGHLVACRPRACRARPANFPGRGGKGTHAPARGLRAPCTSGRNRAAATAAATTWPARRAPAGKGRVLVAAAIYWRARRAREVRLL